MASATPPAGRRKLKPITLIPVTTPTRDAQKSSAQVSFFRDVIYSMRALFPMLFFQLFSYGMIAPIAPILLTNFFAKEPAGYDIQCQTFDPAEKPQACLSAGSTSAFVSAIVSACSAVVGLFASPMMGSLSDVYGRRKFIVFTLAIFAIASASFTGFALGYVSAWPYIVANGVQNGFSSIAISLSWIADVVSPQNRSAAFGIILAVFSLCMVVGPPTSTSMPQNTALLVSTGSSAVAVLYALVVLPESLPPELRKQSIAGLVNPLKSTQILLKTALFRRLTVCVLFQTMSGNGLQDVLVYYLEDQYNFTKDNISLALVLIGISGVLVQGVLIKPLTVFLGHKGLLLLGLTCTFLFNLIFVVVDVKWVVYLNIAVVLSVGLVTFPAVSSIKSINVTPKEQGQIQGALYGVRQLAGGAGPILFSTVYKAFNHKTGGSMPYFPAAPYVLGGALLLIAIGFGVSLPNPVPDLPKEQARFVARQRACSIPTYLPSTPRTPRSIPRRGSTGLYGSSVREASPGGGTLDSSPLLMRTHPDLAGQIVDDVVASYTARPQPPPPLERIRTVP